MLLGTVDSVERCDKLFQQAHGGGMERRNEIHDAVTHSQGVHGWSVYVLYMCINIKLAIIILLYIYHIGTPVWWQYSPGSQTLLICGAYHF